jgi:hypothetical protein
MRRQNSEYDDLRKQQLISFPTRFKMPGLVSSPEFGGLPASECEIFAETKR